MKLIVGICIFLYVGSILARPKARDDPVCGYDACPEIDPDRINVHIVPHTHDDVGWLKTVDQYFYGDKGVIQNAGVQYIIDSVVQALLRDPKKKFIYVESAFFSKWWKNQTPELQEQVKDLVNEGRLEFVGGAWSMNDEATTHYMSLIDHYTLGLKFLKDTFGECGRPLVNWQIDPFGHSNEHASLVAQMGYDGLLFSRLDFADKAKRLEEKSAEMIWHSSPSLGDSSDLFTSVLYNDYREPPGYCFDYICTDEPMIDDEESEDYNIPEKVDGYFKFIMEEAKHYRSNNILITHGEDFHFQDANMYFTNLDKLLKYVNEKHGAHVNLFYSSPTCYIKSLYDSNLTWPVKYDDFFPYATDPHTYWTGYFTSRPTQKRFERFGNHQLKISSSMSALAYEQGEEFESNLNMLRDAMGVMQHHDALTGTAKQAVADDYALLMTKAIKACESNARTVLKQWLNTTVEFQSCLNLNISQCEVTEEESKTYVVTLYNPTGNEQFSYIRIPLLDLNNDYAGYVVLDSEGNEIESQTQPIPSSIMALKGDESKTSLEIVFKTPLIPPLSIDTVYLAQRRYSFAPEALEWTQGNGERFTIGEDDLSLTFGPNGLIEEITSFGVTEKFSQNFFWYDGTQGNNAEPKNRSSGAYIFRPNGTERLISREIQVEYIKGSLVDEVHQIFNEWVSQVVRIYKDYSDIEFNWMVGEIPFEDGKTKEIISKFFTPIKSNGEFWTDSNGREMLKRTRNHRETWDLDVTEKISGNYYPVTAKIAIEDENMRLAVLNDRAQGGSSIDDGTIELMVHRRSVMDDRFGVGEALNETVIARGTHYIFMSQKDSFIVRLERIIQAIVHTPIYPFLAASDSEEITLGQRVGEPDDLPFMIKSLPSIVHLLNFDPWTIPGEEDKSYLLRLENIMAIDEEDASPITINLLEYFANIEDAQLRETTLAANQWIEDAERLKFTPDYSPDGLDSSDERIQKFSRQQRADEDFIILLEPMQIRTFVLTMNQSSKNQKTCHRATLHSFFV